MKNKPAQLANGALFEPTECWFDVPLFPHGFQPETWLFGLQKKRIDCGYMTTRKEGGISFFRLPVVIMRDSFWRNSSHPIINISGGPGAAAWLDEDSINGFWMPNIEANDWQHDIVLYDSRGTGLSQPALHCDNFLEDSFALLANNLLPEEESEQGYKVLEKCHQQLARSEGQFAALHHLGTVRNAHDIADLADLLKVESWHLYGTSYGTRLALEVARLHADKVASIILDSVYPQEIDGEETMPDLYIDAIEEMIQACENEPTCALQYAHLGEKLQHVLHRLQQNAVTLSLQHNNKNVSYVVTPARFYSLLYDAGYDIDNIVAVPNVIQSLTAGKLDALKYLAQNSLDMMLDESFSNPVYMEVECNENEIRNRQAYIDNINRKYQRYPFLKRWQLAAQKDDFCNIWGAEESDDSFHVPVITTKPTLILAGKLDSATPAKWSKAVAERLPNSEYHEFKASGHAVLYNVKCSREIVRRFLNPDKKYKQACNTNNDYSNGQRVVWDSPDVGDVFLQR